MKKLIFALTILTMTSLNAQQRSKNDVELTPILGVAFSNYYGEDRLENQNLSSTQFGADLDFFFNNRWSLRSGLLFQTMGSKVARNYTEKLHYITVPVNANWHFGSTRKWNLNFGPNFSFLTAAEGNGIDLKDEANSFQLGLAYGIGYKIEVNEKFSILIDYQGITGLTDVPKDNYYTIRNTYGSFNIGGVFKL